MLNFTVGPVMSGADVLEVASHSTPYFRTPEFSETMKENESFMLKLLNAPAGSRCAFLTASGTGAMESCVMNILNEKDKVIVINGGSFGQRFVELCKLHGRDYVEVKCEFGKQLKAEQLGGLEDATAPLINMHETSSGLLYDMPMVSDFCKKNNILLIIDAISAFISDELDMSELGAAAVLTGSQKALAVQPGVSLVALAPSAIKRVEENKEVCIYLSLKQALINGERGQTPFTPAVTTLLQINTRLKEIVNKGGVSAERKRIAFVAEEFRAG
ncbi:MAG: aminotransferase class V-fold PLP-dependent enzyme, partial [Butyrivibrio sp.]|nr:aminotransferase class V-fold PLP-dependent enzyme [Butyrivibrio sp.]